MVAHDEGGLDVLNGPGRREAATKHALLDVGQWQGIVPMQDAPVSKKTEREIFMNKLSVLGVTVLTAALIAAAPISLNWSPAKTLSLSSETAQARVGHPLTPGSVAGVHRRVERRTARRRCAYWTGHVCGRWVYY